MTEAAANLGDGLEQTYPFVKLPPEIRLVVYELAIRDHFEDIENTDHLLCGKSIVGMSVDTVAEMLHARRLEATDLTRKSEGMAASYLGALALLHTSKLVYRESYNAMHGLVKRHISARNDVWAERFEWRLRPYIVKVQKLRYEFYEVIAWFSLRNMVDDSFQNTFSRYMEDCESMRAHGNLHGQAKRSAPIATNPRRSTDSATQISREATLMAAAKYFPNIYASIQRRLGGRDGVRTSSEPKSNSVPTGKLPMMRSPS
ncbi:hypothetical protein Q7P35_001293 [Cladosporium inversicolor]